MNPYFQSTVSKLKQQGFHINTREIEKYNLIIFKPVLKLPPTPKRCSPSVTWTQLKWQYITSLIQNERELKTTIQIKMTNAITKCAPAGGSFQSALAGCNTVTTRTQLTCAACSVNESLILTVTFTFASSFADMSMLATHCQCHKKQKQVSNEGAAR